jgi:hypothetical protein
MDHGYPQIRTLLGNHQVSNNISSTIKTATVILTA